MTEARPVDILKHHSGAVKMCHELMKDNERLRAALIEISQSAPTSLPDSDVIYEQCKKSGVLEDAEAIFAADYAAWKMGEIARKALNQQFGTD